jgi:ABC-type glycerol-3-phosphate transport system permease component
MRYLKTVIGLVVVWLMLLPVFWLISISFKTDSEIFSKEPALIPAHPTYAHYANILSDPSYLTFIYNSAVIAVAATLLVIVLAVPAGFGYSRMFSFKGQSTTFIMVLIGRMLPPIALIVPLYEVFARMHLLNTKFGLILIGAAVGLPLAIWMFKTFFDEIPEEIIEAAVLDGCNKLHLLWHIVIPLARHAIASAVTITFLTVWNLFLIPLVFGKSDSSITIPVALSKLAYGEYGTAWGDLAALAVIAIVPVALLGLFCQRYLISGLTSGSGK